MNTVAAILCLISSLVTQAGPGRDVLGDQELAAVTDPSFESVSRHYPAMKHPREVVGVKDGPIEIGVYPSGVLQLGEVNGWFVAGNPASPQGTDAPTKRLLQGCLPIVVMNWDAGFDASALGFRETVFGWSPQLRPDAPPAAFVRLKLSAPAAGRGQRKKIDVEFVAGKPVASWTLDVPLKHDQMFCVKVPLDKPTAAEKIEAAEFDKCLNETVAFWKALLSKGMKICVPEARINDAYRAWLAYNFINVDKRDNVFHICDGGGGFYEQMYGYSASRYCVALDLFGYPEEAREYLDSILTFVKPDGLLVVHYGLPDTGAQLWAMGRHYQITGDGDWLRRVAPTMIKMCDWILNARKASMANQAKNDPWHGMIKYQAFADEGKPAYCFYTDAYLLLGLEETAAALAGIGMTDKAKQIGAQAQAYRKDILVAMDKAVFEHDGMRMLPVFPETRALLKRVNYTGKDYYSLIASCLLETGVLAANDRRARLVTDLLEQRGGLCVGSCAFHGGIDHAYTYGYWMNCLERDEVKRVVLGLYGSLAYGMTQNTFAAAEVTFLKSGKNVLTLPHTYSNTQQLLLLRNMLVRESGDTLILGQAIPRPWLESGKTVSIADAPTTFGKMGYTIKSQKDAARMTVALDPPTKKAPKAIEIRLRHPVGKPIQSVKIDGVENKSFRGDAVTLSGATRRTVIEVGF